MGKTIKTKKEIKGIKTLDKGIVAADHMKETFIRTKDQAEHGLYADGNSPDEYATDKVSGGMEGLARKGARQFNQQEQKVFQETRKNIGKVREKIRTRQGEQAADFENQVSNLPKEQMKAQAQKAAQRTTSGSPPEMPKGIVSVRQSLEETTQQAATTAQKTAQTAVKTSQKAAEIPAP